MIPRARKCWKIIWPRRDLFRSGSKELPLVFMKTVPLVGAVQVYHTDLPPGSLPLRGSPDSLVAPTF